MTDHWQVVELGALCERVRKRNPDGHDRVLTVAAGHGLVDQESYFNRRVAAKNLSGYSVVEKGSFVYNKSYSATAPLGVIAASHHDVPGVVSPLYIVFRPVDPRVSPEFLELAVLSDTTLKTLRTFVKEGGRANGQINISIGDFFSVPVPLPPLEEQRRIVDLIGSIDAYIDCLEGQIDATRLARVGLLAELLTVPADDWEETSLGEHVSVRTGALDVNAAVSGGRYPFFTCAREIYAIDVAAFSGPSTLVAGNGDFNVKFYDGDFNAYQRTYVIQSLNPSVLADRYLNLLLQIAIDQLRLESRGTTIKYLKKGQFTTHKFHLPPLLEQQRIVDVIGSLDHLISALESQVDKAQAIRSGVLQEVLSGDHLLDDCYDMAVGL